ncbi:MAG: RnfABCDGE type electron transport complex subunit G [Candidatus Omnitrophica bacterium]|nr:RnfABCDGE type electron transport complex subunit G [Candidatus Omnitrophota bacterium]
MKEVLKYGLILSAICLIASGLLAGVYSFTKPQIDKQAQNEIDKALTQVVPQANRFEPVQSTDEILYYRGYDKNNKLAGFIFKARAKGYSSTIETLVGLSLQKKIIAIKVIAQNETPGLGSRVTEKTFIQQFTNKNANELSNVSAISGATISSSAVIASVKEKLEKIQNILK